MTRQRAAQLVWALAVLCLLWQIAALRTGWLHVFFFDGNVPYTRGVDFFPLPRAFSNLLAGRSLFDTFHSAYGPYSTWFIYHPAGALLAAPLLLFTPWTAYGLWTAMSIAAMLASAILLSRQGTDPLRRALVGLLLLGSFPGLIMLYSGNAQALLVLSVALVLVAVDRIRQHGVTKGAERLLLAGLLLSLFTKPVVFAMLPLLLLLAETRRTALRALGIYALVSAAFLIVPALNPVALSWSGRLSLLLHPAAVAAMNPFANGLNVTVPMQDNSVHWLILASLNSFRMQHIDVYSLPALLDGWRHTPAPDALFRVPLIFLLEITALVALLRPNPQNAPARLHAALYTLMAAAVLVLLSYGLIWEYHFTLLLPVAGLLLMRPRLDWLDRSVIALAWIAWLPSLYVLLRHGDLGSLSTLTLLHAERVLPAVAMLCLLLFRAAYLALHSPGGLRWPRSPQPTSP